MKRILPSDYNFDIVHIIGNGPSAISFDCSPGLVISTHVPIITSDFVLSNRSEYYGYYGIPTISCKVVSAKTNFAKKLFKPSNVSSILKDVAINDWCSYQLSDVYPKELEAQKARGWTTGHRGYLWVQHQKPKEVHLWGFDAIWNDSDFQHKDSFLEIRNKRWLDQPDDRSNPLELALLDAPMRKELWKKILQPNTKIHK